MVVGYDLPASEIIFHSGNIQYDRLSFRVFENIWTRSKQWGVLVLPPTRLPAVATEKDWLEAVIGLERAAQWSAALTAYEAALSSWPDSYAIWHRLLQLLIAEVKGSCQPTEVLPFKSAQHKE